LKEISKCSEAANSREQQYYYEGNTIIGKNHKSAIVTMVDRQSRHTMLNKATNRTAEAINSIVYRMSNYNKIETINAQKY
jgi:IS30 family transposase